MEQKRLPCYFVNKEFSNLQIYYPWIYFRISIILFYKSRSIAGVTLVSASMSLFKHFIQHTTIYLPSCISTRPSYPHTFINCTHLSVFLFCVFGFSCAGCRLESSSQRNWAAIKHRGVSQLTLSQDPSKFIFPDNPVTARLHASSQRALTAACRETIKNGNTTSPWFYAWTACRPGMFFCDTD